MQVERLVATAPDGVHLSVHRFTPPGATPSTPTVLMAHGWAATHHSWLPVVRRLGGDVRLVAWDQRGHGESRVGSSREALATLTASHTGRDLHAVLRAAVPDESPVVLAGHSLGGLTVLAYAAQFPDEVRARIRGVLLLATAHRSDRHAQTVGESAVMRLLTRALPIRVGRFLPLGTVRRTAFGPGAADAWVTATRDQVASTPLSALGAFHGTVPAEQEARALAVLSGIPTVLLVGERDRMTPPAWSRDLHDRLPGSRLSIVPAAGHMLTYEATDTVIAALAALLGSDPAAARPPVEG